MDTKIIGQRLAVATAISRAGGQQSLARDPSEPRAQARSSSQPAPDAPAANGGAWFDANGDGVIESWSIAHGGDSFANFTPPPTGSASSGGNASRSADISPSAANRSRPPGRTSTPAAMSHAHAAYQRDGLAHAAGAGAAGVPGDGTGPPVRATRAAPRAAGVALRSSVS